VNGCCYGIDNQPDKGDYYKFCGQRFWDFISGDTDLYLKIIEPLGNKAKERNDAFMISYANKLNKFTLDFSSEFCDQNGAIDWEKLVKFNAEKT
jgi:Type II restriction endonuclease EcoO109I